MRLRHYALAFTLAQTLSACSRSAPPAEHPAANVAAAVAEADASRAGAASPRPAPIAVTSTRGDVECPPAAGRPESSAAAESGANIPGPIAEAAPANVERAASSAKNHRGRVKELFDLMQMQRIMDSTLQETLAAQIQANPGLGQFKDIMLEFFAKHMSWKSLEREFIDDYMETFSQAEVEDMIAFYKTPTGAKTISTMPELMKRGSQRGIERVQKHMPELQKMIEQRLQSTVAD